MDRERGAALAEVMIGRRGAELTKDQVGVLERCEALNEGIVRKEEDWKLKVLGWKDLDSPSPDVKMWMKYFPPKKGERSVGTGRAVGVVDCSAEEVAAWLMDYCSNDRMRISKEKRHLARLELRQHQRENEGTFALVAKLPFLLDNREFVGRMIWKSEEGKVLIAVESVDDEVDYGAALRKTRASTRGFRLIEDLPLRGGAKQCRITFVQQIDTGGVLPTWVMDKMLPRSLKVVQEAIDEFRQDDRIDTADREELSALMEGRGRDEVYSEEENALLQRVRQKYEGSLEEGKWKQLKVRSCEERSDELRDE